MNESTREQVAVWRYGLIAPALEMPRKERLGYFRQLENTYLEVPHGKRRRYKRATFLAWLRAYRKEKLEGLKPKGRSDRGHSRKIGSDLALTIRQYRSRYPFLNLGQFYRMLITSREMAPGLVSLGAFRNFLKAQGLDCILPEPKARKKFEKAHINELWTADFMHAPLLRFAGHDRRPPTYLCAMIDDFSRVIVGAQFFFQENTLALETTLKSALATYGLPKMLYCDNGAVFSTLHLHRVCAELGIALVHSQPYDSPSRGKVERFFRTVRQKWLPQIDRQRLWTLEELNDSFAGFLEKDYHRCHHHGIDTRPLDRYLADLNHTAVSRLTPEEIDRVFYQLLTRRVKNDATVSVRGFLYEVPARYIGRRIQLRFPTDRPQELSLWEEGQAVCRLHLCDPVANANPTFPRLCFHRPADEEKES